MFGFSIGTIIKVVAALAIIAALVYGWHVFTESYREQGRAEFRPRAEAAEAANKTLAANLATLQATLKEQAAAVDELKADELVAQAITRAELARIAKDAKKYADEVARLKAIAAQAKVPVSVPEDSAAADRILRELVRQRAGVRQ